MKKNLKIALASPIIKLCDPRHNAEVFAECALSAERSGADVIVFPELALTGATAGDLYFQDVLISAADAALESYIKATAELKIMSFIGLPVRCDGVLYNSVVCVSEGEIIGVTASGLATRHFAAIRGEVDATVASRRVTLARDNIYTDEETDSDIFVKVGDDNAYSSDGVDVIINPVAMSEYIGLADERRAFANEISSSLGVAFVLVGAGEGESGTDGIYASPRLVSIGGETVTESKLFSTDIVYSEIVRKRSFKAKRIEPQAFAAVRSPFIPKDSEAAFALALEIQSRSLALRIKRAYAKTAVIGVSGGLDSTLAVLVAAKSMDILGYGRDKVIAITMPCFGTTERTKSNALALAEELGCSVRTIDIKNAVNQHFIDISHDEKKYDVVYENAQARERTQILMDIANAESGLVIGTGDLSELALGFATYNGDHMSMYCVNGSVPKTLMRSIIAYAAKEYKNEDNEKLASVLTDVINTPISPELLPSENGENSQHTESIVGPYELHDFFLYYTVKYGFSPARVLELAKEVFTDYAEEDIKNYLKVFIRRFFSQQFKRSCLPDGPRVTEISLSPRGAWQMPSDVSGDIWKEDLN